MESLAAQKFDAVVVGTDCIQALLAAALSRAGQTVLVIDENDYYGGDMVSHNFDNLIKWASEHHISENNQSSSTTAAPAAGVWDNNVTITDIPPVKGSTVAGTSSGEELKNPEKKNKQQSLKCVAAKSPKQNTFSVSEISCHDLNPKLVAPFDVAVGNRVVVFAPDPLTGKAKPCTPKHRGWGPPLPPPVRKHFCRGVVKAIDLKLGMVTVKLDWQLANAGSAMLYVHRDQVAHEKDVGLSPLNAQEAAMKAFKETKDQSRKYSIDVQPRLLMSRGNTIEALIRTGVSKYMEFKLLDGTYVGSVNENLAQSNKGNRTNKPAMNQQTSSGKQHSGNSEVTDITTTTSPMETSILNIEAVPCSKSDVFKNRSLSRRDKLTLMKFLQFCMDFHIEDYERVSLSQQNETLPLGTGRSLKRPQNKRKANYDYASHVNKPFILFLRDCVGLSDKLVTIAFHAIALASCDHVERPLDSIDEKSESSVAAANAMVQRIPTVSTRQGMVMISLYLGSLGRYGHAAYLCPMYGSCELPQAFSRYSAVHGGTFVLRTPVDGIVVSSHDSTVRGVCSGGLVFEARHVVCPPRYMPHLAQPRRETFIARGIFILNGPNSENEGGVFTGNRSLCVLPPRTPGVDNPCAVRVLQLDHTSMQVPRNTSSSAPSVYLIQISTLVVGQTQVQADGIVKRAMATLVRKRNQGQLPNADKSAINFKGVHVVWSVHYHEKLYQKAQQPIDVNDSNNLMHELPAGLGICFEGSSLFRPALYRETSKSSIADPEAHGENKNDITSKTTQPVLNEATDRSFTGELASMHFEAAFVTAQRLFNQICPGAEFLPEQDRSDGDASGGVGGSAFDEGGDWDSLEVAGLDAK